MALYIHQNLQGKYLRESFPLHQFADDIAGIKTCKHTYTSTQGRGNKGYSDFSNWQFHLIQTKMNFFMRQVLETLINRQAKKVNLCKNTKGEIRGKSSTWKKRGWEKLRGRMDSFRDIVLLNFCMSLAAGANHQQVERSRSARKR